MAKICNAPKPNATEEWVVTFWCRGHSGFLEQRQESFFSADKGAGLDVEAAFLKRARKGDFGPPGDVEFVRCAYQ